MNTLFSVFLHLRRFPSHIITSAFFTLQTNLFSYKVFMEGGLTDNPSARRNCAGTIPSSVTEATLLQIGFVSCKAMSKIFRVSLVFEFQLIFHLSRHIKLLLKRLILSPLLMDNLRYLSN